jgi:CheY-like chemotaxis protein
VPHTLLLADDSVTIQRVIELTFADEDVRVVAVSDGDQAIARIEAAPPDIILADVGMPGKNGYEVAQHVKASPRLSHIPVVLLTGAFEPVDQARATQTGCEGVLAKPFEPQLVIGRVKELLNRSGGPSAVPLPDASPIEMAPPRGLADQLFGALTTPVPPPGGAAALTPDLNNYFDRLDQAFADLESPAAPSTPSAPAGRPQTPPAAEIDWFKPSARKPDSVTVPEKSDTPAPPLEVPQAAPPRSTAPAAMPPLLDAFAALLSAEQGPAAPSPRPPASAAAPAPAASGAVEITDEVLEEVTRRVLSRMSDAVVRQRVSELVSSIAERLVREEIERIKAAIK